jgi:hypothetical protein
MADHQHIIDVIRNAFRDTEHPGDAFPQGSSQGCEPAEVVSPFKGVRHWTEIDETILDSNESALSFLSEGGGRHFLPAYLIADLRGQLRTADPVFHLMNGLASERTIEAPACGRMHRRSTGRTTLVNPRLYGAMTFGIMPYGGVRYLRERNPRRLWPILNQSETGTEDCFAPT